MVTVEAKVERQTFAAEKEKLFADLYECAFPLVARFISNRKGTLQDAKDIFQDALVIFYEKQLVKDLAIKVSDEAYLLGIAKHLWFRKHQHDKTLVPLDGFEAAITIPEDFFPSVATDKLIRFLERTGKKCMDLLQAFYYDTNSLRDITAKFGYGSTHSATVQKFKCLEKIRDTVKEKSLAYDDFIE